MAEVYVIVLNWNGSSDTIECIETLLRQKDVSLRCIVVDNGSQDDSVERIRARYPELDLIQTQKNLGYSGGMNTGIRYALERGARYILLLNNDTLADENMVCQLLKQIQDGADIAAPAIFYAEAPERLWSIGGKIDPLFLELLTPHGGSIPIPPGPIERDFVTGCAMLVQRSVFEQVGVFDEVFYPGYYEDLDFCLRVRRQGLTIQMTPQARLLHKISQSSGGKSSPKVAYLMGRNSGLYFRKHARFWQLPFVLGFRLLSAIKRSVLLVVQRDGKSLSAYWTGLANGWLGLFQKSSEKYLSFYSPRSGKSEYV